MAVALVLVGAPGSGKSTVGRLLADALGLPFHDTDDAVARAAGMSIGDIFIVSGEEGFRELERDAVLRGLGGDGVLALGGGAVASPQVRDALAGLPVVWLQVDDATAVRRVGLSGPRPVLLGNVRGRWAELLQTRQPWYREVARWTVHTEGRTPEQVAADILHLMTGGADHG